MSTNINSAFEVVLGTIMNHPELLDEAMAKIKPSDISDFGLKSVYEAAISLSKKDIVFDRAAIESQLTSDSISSTRLLRIDQMSAPVKFKDYLYVVKDASIKREVDKLCTRTKEDLAYDKDLTSENALSRLSSAISDMCANFGSSENTHTYKSLLPNFIEKMKTRVNLKSGVTGVASGFDKLDKITAGFQPADLIILAARPSMGKTSFAMNIAESILTDGDRVLVFSMEMPGEALLQRSLASIGTINQSNLKTGQLTDLEAARLKGAVDKLDAFDIVLDDSADLNVTELRLIALKAHKEKPLTMIMVDYLQLMNGSDSNAKDRTGEISHISRGLKKLAKELNIPVVALSQLNRSLEQRADKRPINSDLRESGAIEQDADIIMFVYRDEVYNNESPDKNVAEIILGKHRNGALGTIRLAFAGKYSRFENIEKIQKLEPTEIITPPADGYVAQKTMETSAELLL